MALKAIPKEKIEPRKSWVRGGFDILFERDHRRELEPRGGTSHFALIMRDNIHSVEEHGFDSCLPRPERKRIIG